MEATNWKTRFLQNFGHSRNTDIDPRTGRKRRPYSLMKPTIGSDIVQVAQPSGDGAHPTHTLLDGFLGWAQGVSHTVSADAEVVTDQLVVLVGRVAVRRSRHGEFKFRRRECQCRGGREAVLFEDLGLNGRHVELELRLRLRHRFWFENNLRTGT